MAVSRSSPDPFRAPFLRFCAAHQTFLLAFTSRKSAANLGWANAALGGWQFAGIHNYSSGAALQVGYSGFSIPVGFASGIRPSRRSN